MFFRSCYKAFFSCTLNASKVNFVALILIADCMQFLSEKRLNVVVVVVVAHTISNVP